jgi:hypothetical protein
LDYGMIVPVDGIAEAVFFGIPGWSNACFLSGRFCEPTMLTQMTVDD